MPIDQIEIIVKGPTGCGKTGVMDTVIEALKSKYGPHVQIASHDMAVELAGRNRDDISHPPVSKTVFVVREENVSRGKTDTSEHCTKCPCMECNRQRVGEQAVAVL